MSYSSNNGGRGRGRAGGGRGEYYKNKYGGRGRGRSSSENTNRIPTGGGAYRDLHKLLQSLDGKSYPAYHDLDTPIHTTTKTRGGWRNDEIGFSLYVAQAQSDPFAPPTRCRVVVDASKANFPKDLYSNRIRAVALADYLLRNLYDTCKQLGANDSMGGKGWAGPKGGDLQVLEPCQHVLEQSAVRIDRDGNVIAQITINLPARGRTILGHAAETIFGQTIPTMVKSSLYYSALSAAQVRSHVEIVEDQVWLQSQLEARHLVAFVCNGAILPRMSGVDDRPMNRQSAVSFQSPKRLEISFSLPNNGSTITGMGIPKGITLICGGGFHGKSTLLETLQLGIYPKIPGDGREFCMTTTDACKIRAEDGRQVQAVDISNFINNLPHGKDTVSFSTMNASGSTSQATSIVEAVECGTNTLLIDEDTCATNFMIRDDKMMQLVAEEKEPITPFVRIVRSLYNDCGVSSVLVIGGTGDFFDVADNVLVMDSYKCLDATEKAKTIVANSKNPTSLPHTASKSVTFCPTARKRILNATKFFPNGKVKTVSQDSVSYGEVKLDLSCLEQIVGKSQTIAIANLLQRLSHFAEEGKSIPEILTEAIHRLDTEGLEFLAPNQCHGGMARPRLYEFAGAINRLRCKDGIQQA